MIKVVTIDFWNTLFDSANGPQRNTARKAALREAITACGGTCEEELLNSVYHGIWDYFDHHWLNHRRTPTSEEMLREMLRGLNHELPDDVLADVAEVYERGILEHPPGLHQGAAEALEFLAARADLALISDTAFSGGAVLRELMEQVDIARYFSVFVFSNETGVAKPHPEAFQRALEPLGATPDQAFHIGDIERTDIRGARGAGMKAVLYRADRDHKYAEETTEAEEVLDHWNEITDVYARLSGS